MNPSGKTFTPRKITKRGLQDNPSGQMSKSPRSSTSQVSAYKYSEVEDSKTITLRQLKALGSTAYSNNLSFEAKALIVEPKQSIMDPRVQFHRQRILFADATTFLNVYMHSDPDEDCNNPKIAPKMTNAVTNFRVIQKGEILIHNKSTTSM